MRGIFFLFAAITLLLASCGLPARLSQNIGTGETLAIYGVEGRWAGPVKPEDVSCGPITTGLMTVGSGAFGFDPFQSTAIIQGTVRNGKLTGALVRPGGNKQQLSLRFEGQAARDSAGKPAIAGVLESGRCRWTVELERK